MADEPLTSADAPAASDDPFAVRRAKLDALNVAGIEAYRDRWDVTDHAADLEQRYVGLEPGAETEDVVSLAGRLVAKRDQGKIVFLVVRDGSGEIQLFTRVNVLGDEAFEAVKELDLGDWVGTRGTVLRTRRGELSVAPTQVVLLSKSLRPLPEKFHGLSDTETRFKVIAAIRRYMESLGFVEVETPMLHAIPGGATARPFVTHHNALDMPLYLRIAPELYLKRLLVGGFEKVYEINRSFRNEGISVRHNPEFTMLEAYQAFTNIEGMMDLTEGIVQTAAHDVLGTTTITYEGVTVDLGSPWRRATMIELTSAAAGEDVSFERTLDELRTLCERHEVPVDASWGQGKLITELFEKLAERTLEQPTFVTDYPLETSPLARKKSDDPRLTDRFELIITGREFANAFSELVDPVDQRERFAAQIEAKTAGDDEAMGYDEDYLRAMEYGMPPAGGMGIGIDRLVMLLTDSSSIRDVLLFPHLRPEA